MSRFVENPEDRFYHVEAGITTVLIRSACENAQAGVPIYYLHTMGAQWLSGRVLDSRPKGRGFEPHRRHCAVVLEQDTFILA